MYMKLSWGQSETKNQDPEEGQAVGATPGLSEVTVPGGGSQPRGLCHGLPVRKKNK